MIAQFCWTVTSARAAYKLSGMPGNPVRIPGDRVTINDASVMSSSSRAAIVIGLMWRYGEMSYTMDMEAVDAASLYRIWGKPRLHFVIGTNRLGGGGCVAREMLLLMAGYVTPPTFCGRFGAFCHAVEYTERESGISV